MRMGSHIRDWLPEDRERYLELSRQFYQTDAVLHPAPEENFAATFAETMAGSPYIRGLALCRDGEMAGYALLSLTWSNEAGGLCVLLEEAYVVPEAQGQGLGGAFLDFVQQEYAGKARRLRLEVTPGNTRAAELYARKGYEPLDYLQMVHDQ